MPNRYPAAEWVPWKWNENDPAFYYDGNTPEAVVLHVAEGWATTIRTWARDGYSGASWHYTVCRDGQVLQHLDHNHGGYHAGIAPFRRDGTPNPQPTWKRWKGWGVNVNRYTIGVEHEGFTGTPMPSQQAAASKALCKWLAAELGIPFERERFPAHADIALIDRANDFNSPQLREEHYAFLFAPDAPPPSVIDPTKVRMVPVGGAEVRTDVDWSDKPDERWVTVTTKQRMRLVVDP